ncbi:MAG: type II toxin-antitoxin system VapC family toxin [Candidatus Eremiobacterota bacterium]
MKIEYLLDTNVVCELTRREPEPSVLRRLRAAWPVASISAISWHEIQYGLLRIPEGSRRDEIQGFVSRLAGMPVLPYAERPAMVHARARAALEQAGLPMGYADAQVASTAVAHGLTLVTRNTRHFRHFPGLRMENWFPA